MPICNCESIEWEKYYNDFHLYDPNTCGCCYCKKRRNEIDKKTYKKICKDYILYYSKGKKHIFPPCTWQ